MKWINLHQETIPYILEDEVYAMPETLDFNATFYRVDMMNSLGLTPPNEWDDVLKWFILYKDMV